MTNDKLPEELKKEIDDLRREVRESAGRVQFIPQPYYVPHYPPTPWHWQQPYTGPWYSPNTIWGGTQTATSYTITNNAGTTAAHQLTNGTATTID